MLTSWVVDEASTAYWTREFWVNGPRSCQILILNDSLSSLGFCHIMASSPFLLSTTLCPPFKTEAICVLEWTNTHTHTHMHTWKNTFHLLWPCWFSSPTSRELSDRWAGLLNIPFLQFIASHPLSGTRCFTGFNQYLLETVLSIESANLNKILLLPAGCLPAIT